MSTIAEVVVAIQQMTDEDREVVRRALDELEVREFQEEGARATREFHARGLTDDDIDRAMELLRQAAKAGY